MVPNRTSADSRRRGARLLTAIVLASALLASEASAQLSVELSYGADRNVDSEQPETDGWVNATVEWLFASGLGIGIGTDHQFEGASVGPNDHLGWAIYASTSYERALGDIAPFVRGGIGAGRAPCQGDTCGDGLHLRGSAGVRIRIAQKLRLSGEVGVSRVSRPFGGAGLSYRF